MPLVLKLPLILLQDQLLECLPPFAAFTDTAMLICQLEIVQCCTASYVMVELCLFEFTKLDYSDLPR